MEALQIIILIQMSWMLGAAFAPIPERLVRWHGFKPRRVLVVVSLILVWPVLVGMCVWEWYKRIGNGS